MSPEEQLQVRERPGGLIFQVRVHPKSSRDELVEIREGALWLRVTAPPVSGQANQACLDLLTRTLGVPRGSVAMTAGGKSRHKLIQVSGISVSALLAAVEAALDQGK